MNERLRAHVEMLFADAPKDARYEEVKEELLANLNEKYEDLIAQGKSEETAISAAISGIGDIDELFRYIRPTQGESQQRDRGAAVNMIIAASLSMVVLVICFFVCYALHLNLMLSLGLSIAFGILVAALFVYLRPSAQLTERKEGTLVESLLKNQPYARMREIRKSVNSILWALSVVVYVLISFYTHAWWITWVIFPATALLQQIIGVAILYLSPNRNPSALLKQCTSCLWLLIVIVYFLFSFGFRAWAFSWVIFIIGAALTQVLRLVFTLWKD